MDKILYQNLFLKSIFDVVIMLSIKGFVVVFVPFLKGYKYMHGFSIDVVLGCFFSSLSLNICLNLSFSYSWVVCLIGGVWLIYNLDHQWDIIRFKKQPDINIQDMIRYYVHQKYCIWVYILSVMIISIIFYCILNSLKLAQLIYGIFLTLLMIFYFYQKKINLNCYRQELIIAIIYTLGIVSTSWLELQWSYPLEGYLCGICFLLLAYLNLITISLFEVEFDLESNSSTFIIQKGIFRTYFYFFVCTSLLTIFACLIFFINPNLWKIVFVFLMMELLILCVLLFQSFLKKKECYRLVIESFFYLPSLLLIGENF